jgi:hypothetical protein
VLTMTADQRPPTKLACTNTLFWRGDIVLSIPLSEADCYSDILSEIDGVPLQRIHSIIATLSHETMDTPPKFEQDEEGRISAIDYQILELKAHLQLRGYMNAIFNDLYIRERGYCRPPEVAIVLTEIARRLDLWYWTLPLDLRFPRHPTSFELTPQSTSGVMVSALITQETYH